MWRTAWVVCAVMGVATGLTREARAAVGVPLYAASVLTQVAKLGGIPDPEADLGDRFGDAIAVNGNTAAVGAPASLAGPGAGAVLVFVHSGSTWSRQAVLLPGGPASAFGAALALSGDTLVVGAPGLYYSGTGSTYVYVRTGLVWTLQASLAGTDDVTDDGFGAAVAVDGDTLVIGAPRATSGFGGRAGAAYVFVRSGSVWTLQQKVLPATLAADDGFGTAVAVAGDTAMIGSPGDDTEFGGNSGSVFVFGRSGGSWSERQRLVRQGATPADAFGRVVALAGSVAVVGAPAAPNGPFATGVADVFGWTGAAWAQQAELTPSGNEFGFARSISLSTGLIAVAGNQSSGLVHLFRDNGSNWVRETILQPPPLGPEFSTFGAPLGLAGDTLIVGAQEYFSSTTTHFSAVIAFAFNSGAWVEEARLPGWGTTSRDAFGTSMSVDGDVMVVGSPNDNTPSGQTSGSATVFQKTAGTWVAIQKLLPGPEDNYHFGRTVSVSGDLVAVASGSYPSDRLGVVSVFRKTSTWALEQKITPPVWPETGFGAALAIQGDTLFVGEPGVAVSVFVRTAGQWLLQQKLTAAGPNTYQSFGSSLALRGELALVGAPGFSTTLGTVSVFRASGGVWSLTQTLRGPDNPNERFGSSVAIGTTEIAVGSPPDGSGAGSVFVFDETAGAFSLRQRLRNPTYGAQTYPADFGRGVALSGDLLLTFTTEDGLYPRIGGIAFVYGRSGAEWQLRSSLRAPVPRPDEQFGRAGAVVGGEILVGAPGASLPEVTGSGAVYVFGSATTNLTLSVIASPASAVQGEAVTFDVMIGNNGPTVHPGPILRLDLASQLIFSSASLGCANGTGTPLCILPPLAPGAQSSVRIVTTAAVVGTALSSFEVQGDGPSAPATTTILAGPGADVRLGINGANPEARRGDTLAYSLYIQNLGPGVAAGLRIDGSAPGLIDVCVESGSCVIPSLAANRSYLAYLGLRVPLDYAGPNPISNTLTLTTATGDPNPGNNTLTVTTPLASTRMLFHTVSPCRLVDTRESGLGGPDPLPPGPTTYSATSGACGVSSSARALAVNLTVTQPSSAGFLKAYAASTPSVPASFVNYKTGETRSNDGIVGLDVNGRFVIEVGQVTGTAHVIVDVVGFFQ